MDSSLQLGIATEASDLPLTAKQWNELIVRAPTNTVFQTYEWFDAWWRTFGASHRLHFVWVRRRGQIVAFAPLMVTAGRLGLRRIEFVGAGNADYLDFCYPADQPSLMHAMLQWLQSHSADWDVFRLANLPMQSATFRYLSVFVRQHGMRLLHEATVPCPTLLIKEREEQIRALLDKYSMRRKINWFGRHGQLRIVHLSESAAIKPHLPQFFDQHTERWRASGAPSQFERPLQREFFERLAETMTASKALVFTVVFFEAEPLAYHFGFDYGGCMLWYKSSFNTRYAAHSPGVVLMRGLIEEAMRTGKSEFDYTVGAETFKFRYSNAVRANAYMNVYNGRGRYGVALAVHALWSAARSILRALRAESFRKSAAET